MAQRQTTSHYSKVLTKEKDQSSIYGTMTSNYTITRNLIFCKLEDCIFYTLFFSIPKSVQLCSTNMSYSTKELSSKSTLILSLEFNFPALCCFSILSKPPPSNALARISSTFFTSCYKIRKYKQVSDTCYKPSFSLEEQFFGQGLALGCRRHLFFHYTISRHCF